MKFPAPYVRKQLSTILNGNVDYNSQSIPTYDGEAPLLSSPFIIMGGYSHTRQRNKCGFTYEAQQAIEVITIKDDPSSKISDGITEVVMNILDALDWDISTTDFQILIEGESVGVVREDSMSGQKVFRRLITYNLFIEEK